MSLKHVKREPSRHHGRETWRLKDPDGDYIAAFDEFAKNIADEKYATKKRYSEVVSRFIDYLYEAGILGGRFVTRGQVNQAIDYYLLLLRDGENLRLGTKRGDGFFYDDGDERREAGLRRIAQQLGIRPLAPRSWSNTIAPLNRFLRVCSMLQDEAHQLAELRGKLNLRELQAFGVDYKPLIDAVDGCSLLSRAEVKHIKQTSFLGAVIRFRGSELSRPRGVSAPKIKKAQRDTEVLDFPMAEFPKLLSAATCWRDKTLWLLTAASGIRRSEALNVEWHHIDFDRQTVYVLDPEYARYGRDLSDEERHRRFKGRVVSWTYLRSPYRQWFFEALLEYRKREYVLPANGNEYVFQYVSSDRRGVPYRQASDQTLNKSFTAAVVRAGIQGPPMNPDYVWTQHSLRHAYGVFLLNDMIIPGQDLPGLTEAEVQLLMGHASVLSTRKYARTKETRLIQKLESHDRNLLGQTAEEQRDQLPEPLAQRLLATAKTKITGIAA